MSKIVCTESIGTSVFLRINLLIRLILQLILLLPEEEIVSGRAIMYVNNDIYTIVTEALKTIPEQSKFHRCITDVYKRQKRNYHLFSLKEKRRL